MTIPNNPFRAKSFRVCLSLGGGPLDVVDEGLDYHEANEVVRTLHAKYRGKRHEACLEEKSGE